MDQGDAPAAQGYATSQRDLKLRTQTHTHCRIHF